MPDPYELGKPLLSFRKSDEVRIHVRLGRILDEKIIDIRDYFPDTKNYGRGIIVPDSYEARKFFTELLRRLG